MGKFVIKETKTGFKFDLKAGNGEVIATSEVYSALKSAQNGAESVKNNAPVANVEDQTVEGYATEKHPKFEMYTDKSGEYRFRLKAKNGEIVQAVLDTLKEKTGGDMTLREAYAILQMVQYTIEAEAMSATRTQTVADVHL